MSLQGLRKTLAKTKKSPQSIDITGFVVVSQRGFEPRTNGLKGRCSTS